MKKIRKRLKQNRAGFSLSEVLMAVLILSLVSVLLVSGMVTVNNTYRRSVDKANAETLLSTTVTELRNEMAFASDVYKIGDTSFGYRNSKGVNYTVVSSADGILVNTMSSDGTVLSSRNLVSDAASTRLCNGFSGVSVNSDGTLTITTLSVTGSGYTNPLSTLSALVIGVQTVR